MAIREAPRVLFSLPFDAPDAEPGDGLAVARMPGGAVVVQIALDERRLRGFTAARPPSVTMPPEAAIAMALEILRELRPDLARALEAHERRAALRVVGAGASGGDAA